MKNIEKYKDYFEARDVFLKERPFHFSNITMDMEIMGKAFYNFLKDDYTGKDNECVSKCLEEMIDRKIEKKFYDLIYNLLSKKEN